MKISKRKGKKLVSSLLTFLLAISYTFVPMGSLNTKQVLADTISIENNGISPAVSSIAPGSTEKLTAAAAEEQSVRWVSSDDSNKVAVNEGGLVIVAPDAPKGAYTITVKSAADGTILGTATVIVKDYLIKTFAGTGAAGYLGNGESSSNAQLNYPSGVAVDNSGNVYIADTVNGSIRKVDASTGNITTVAGTGTRGFSGDGGPATSAKLYNPWGVALDSAGNIYIADSGNYRIRKVDINTGIINTIAGNGLSGITGNGAAAVNARLNFPQAVAVDRFGNVFIADTNNNQVRMLDVNSGNIYAYAGTGTAGYSGDGAYAADAEISCPSGLAFDKYGNLLIADYSNHRVRVVDMESRTIDTIAGTGTAGHSGDGGPAIDAQLNGTNGVAVDSVGNIYITDYDGNCIRKIDGNTGIITTVAGVGTSGFSGDWGIASQAQLSGPTQAAVDSRGNVYIADASNNRVRVATLDTPNVTFTVTDGTNPISGAEIILGQNIQRTNALGQATFVNISGGNIDYNISAAGFTTKYGTISMNGTDLNQSITMSTMEQVSSPTATPGSESTVSSGSTVTLTSTTSGAEIHYTTDGTEPNLQSTIGNTITINGQPGANVTVKAIATKPGMTNSSVSTFTYIIAAPLAPTITGQPINQTALQGKNISLRVTATGDAPLSYQWKKNGVNIDGATGSVLNLNNVQAINAGTYTVVVTNAAGSVTSIPAVLIVISAPISSGTSGGSSPTPLDTITGSVLNGNTGNQVSDITANVTTNSNGDKTISMDASQAIVLKQADGTKSKLSDTSKLTISTSEGAPITISSDGTIKIENIAKGTDNNYKVSYDLGNGQKIVIGTMEIKVETNGDVSLVSTLIDPYGVITDSTTGKAIDGVNITLYYANTDRNKAAGKIPDTVVPLPGIDGFKPNNNKNPQVSNAYGEYGFMVFPTSDYYLVATKEGYNKYISPVISVEQKIVKWDLRLNPIVNSSQTTGVQRLAGQTRIDTALNIAKATYTGKISNVVLVASDDYPDALSGSVLAYKLNAPMLLIGSTNTDKDKILSYMKSNLDASGNVYLLGGEGVISKAFADKVKSFGFSNITRLGGVDRYETSQKIAEKLNVNEETPVIIASGENYPDALSVSSIAAINQYPILLVKKDEIPDTIKSEISKINPTKVFIIGLQGAVSSSVETNISQITPVEKSNVSRIGGTDRYETSIEVSKYFNLTGSQLCLSTGNDFPDSLAGSIFAAKNNAPIILVNKNLTDNEISFLKDRKLSGINIFGGESVVNKDIQQQLSQIIVK